MINLLPTVLGSSCIHLVRLCTKCLDFKSSLFHELWNVKRCISYKFLSFIFCNHTETIPVPPPYLLWLPPSLHIFSSFTSPHLPLAFSCFPPYYCYNLSSFPCSRLLNPTSPGTPHDLFPWEICLKSKIKAKHFNWIKIVFLPFLQMQQSGFYWKLSTLQKSLQGQAPPRCGAAPLQQGQSILCHVQTPGCSVGLPSSSPKTLLPFPENVPAFSLVHVPQCAV